MADMLAEMSGEGASGSGNGSGIEIGSGSGENESEEEEDEPLEYVEVSEDFYYMAHVIRLMAFLHAVVSLAMLVAYYHLKVRPFLYRNSLCISIVPVLLRVVSVQTTVHVAGTAGYLQTGKGNCATRGVRRPVHR